MCSGEKLAFLSVTCQCVISLDIGVMDLAGCPGGHKFYISEKDELTCEPLCKLPENECKHGSCQMTANFKPRCK